MEFVAIWLLCGLLALPLFVLWWTSEVPLTTDELPGLILFVAFGPFAIGWSIVLCLSMVIGWLWRRLFPTSKVMIGRWK